MLGVTLFPAVVFYHLIRPLYNVFQQQFSLRHPSHLGLRVELIHPPPTTHPKKENKLKKGDEYVGVKALKSTEVTEVEVNMLLKKYKKKKSIFHFHLMLNQNVTPVR